MSAEHAIYLRLQRYHQAWSKSEVASLLLLGVLGAYGNVSRERLLHNLRKLRISLSIVGWVDSFISERSTTIKLREYTRPTPTTCYNQGLTVLPIPRHPNRHQAIVG
jgi:hypothetical protein